MKRIVDAYRYVNQCMLDLLIVILTACPSLSALVLFLYWRLGMPL